MKTKTHYWVTSRTYVLILITLLTTHSFFAQSPELEINEVITRDALFLNGSRIDSNSETANFEDADDAPYRYRFGTQLVADGDCITAIDGFIFFVWYKGDRNDRHIQVSRYNPNTNQTRTFQLNWQHTGFRGNKNVGESHNTIAVGISPKDKTMHLLYDMHAYTEDTSSNPGFYTNRIGDANGRGIANRYFRYSYSIGDVTAISDNQWTQENVLVRAKNNEFKGNFTHNSLNGTNNAAQYEKLTYPRFFLNENDDLFFQMRVGGDRDGSLRFFKYNATNKSWGNFTAFNVLGARRQPGINYNWGLYGEIKFLNNKIAIGFQRRTSIKTDKYRAQDGFYFATATNTNATSWQSAKGDTFTAPIADPTVLRIVNPERKLPNGGSTAANQISMTGPFDFTITGDDTVHMIGRVGDLENNNTIYVHSYGKGGNFTHDILPNPAERIYSEGDKIYLIGLNNSRRVIIQEAASGTNSFRTIYEDTGRNDPSYRNITARLIEGKVYILGLEIDSALSRVTSKQPLRLQVIDLNISNTPNITNVEENTWYKIKNLETGRYLRAVGGGNIVAASVTTGADKEWRFVKSGDYYNIDSRTTGDVSGILRAVGNSIIGTRRTAPRADIDKVWRINNVSSPRGSFRFELRDTGRYIYNETTDGNKVINLNTKIGNRSKWVLEPTGAASKSLNDKKLEDVTSSQIYVYPNPTASEININLEGINEARVHIVDMLGKLVYSTSTTSKTLHLTTADGFVSGLYFIQVVSDTGKVFNKKLLVK